MSITGLICLGKSSLFLQNWPPVKTPPLPLQSSLSSVRLYHFFQPSKQLTSSLPKTHRHHPISTPTASYLSAVRHPTAVNKTKVVAAVEFSRKWPSPRASVQSKQFLSKTELQKCLFYDSLPQFEYNIEANIKPFFPSPDTPNICPSSVGCGRPAQVGPRRKIRPPATAQTQKEKRFFSTEADLQLLVSP